MRKSIFSSTLSVLCLRAETQRDSGVQHLVRGQEGNAPEAVTFCGGGHPNEW